MRFLDKPELLNGSQAADFLGVSPGTLTVWRCTKRYDLTLSEDRPKRSL